MALVCPPQVSFRELTIHFLSRPIHSIFGHTFIHVMEPTKDANGVAWFTESGYAIRRKALESISRWPVGPSPKNTFTSSLHCNLAPSGILHRTPQATHMLDARYATNSFGILSLRRLGEGHEFLCSLERIGLRCRHILQDLPRNFLAHRPLCSHFPTRWQVRLCFASLILTRLNEWITYLPSGNRLAQTRLRRSDVDGSFHAMTIVRSLAVPSWFGGKAMVFSSGSIICELNERTPLVVCRLRITTLAAQRM
jgi:hypothetical protein